MSFVFTSESVTSGHPDKLADAISDSILDTYLAQDPKARVAVETFVTNGLCVIGGEVRSDARVELAIQHLTLGGEALTLALQVPVHGRREGQARHQQEDAAGQRGGAQTADTSGSIACEKENHQRRNEKHTEHVADIPVPPFEARARGGERAARRQHADPPTRRNQTADQAARQQQAKGVGLLFERFPAFAQPTPHEGCRHRGLQRAAAGQCRRQQHQFGRRAGLARCGDQVHREGTDPDRRNRSRSAELQHQTLGETGGGKERACKTLWQRYQQAHDADHEVRGGHGQPLPGHGAGYICWLCCRGRFERHLGGFAGSRGRAAERMRPMVSVRTAV